MRPRPLVPSSRRTLATLATLLISAALSLGFVPLSNNLIGHTDLSGLALDGEPCDVEKVSASVATVSASSPALTEVSPATTADSGLPSVSEAISKASAAVAAVEPRLSPASPIGLLEGCEGVRPGGIVTTEGSFCTYNFVFTDGINRYIGTAGHCALETPQISSGPLDPVERSWSPGSGPVAMGAEGNRVGVFVYGVRNDVQDFALIRLDPGVPVNPAMCHFGGPTGMNNDSSGSTVLHYYGNGQGIGTLVPARSAVALDMSDPNVVPAHGVAVPGDSGAGVISADGRAVGVISTLPIGPTTVRGTMHITRIGPQIARAEQVLGLNLELVTAPLQ